MFVYVVLSEYIYYPKGIYCNMKRSSLAVLGVGNMAKAILNGIIDSSYDIKNIVLFDVNKEQYTSLLSYKEIICVESAVDAINKSDCVLISVKPQNYNDILSDIKKCEGYENKLYISIGAGISTDYVRSFLGDVSVIRVLPNLPMVIGKGLSVICRNVNVSKEDFNFVKDIFASSGGVLEIEEGEMNRIIGVTSSSPAYVFKFIDAIYKGAIAQGVEKDGLLDAICDMIIGSALMIKKGNTNPSELAAQVASKGGTTERALATLEKYNFTEAIIEAMKACTLRADELGASK